MLHVFCRPLCVPTPFKTIQSHAADKQLPIYLAPESFTQHVFDSLYLFLGALSSLKLHPAVRFCRLWQHCPTTAWLSPGQCSVFRALTVEDSAAVCLKRGLKTERGSALSFWENQCEFTSEEPHERGIKTYKTHIVTQKLPKRRSLFAGQTVFLSFLCHQI